MALPSGAYIAEEVAPWIDESGNIVPATGGPSIGMPQTTGGGTTGGTGGSAGTPGSTVTAQLHKVQPKPTQTPPRPGTVVNVLPWRERQIAAEPYNSLRPPTTHARTVQAASKADPTRHLMDHQSHEGTVPVPPLRVGQRVQSGDITLVATGTAYKGRMLIVRVTVNANEPGKGFLSDFVRVKVGGRTVKQYSTINAATSTSVPLWSGQRVSVYALPAYASQSNTPPGPPKDKEPDETILVAHPDGSYTVIGDVERKSPDEQLPPYGNVDTSTDYESSFVSARARRAKSGVWFLTRSP
jgi:hypothetical protein